MSVRRERPCWRRWKIANRIKKCPCMRLNTAGQLPSFLPPRQRPAPKQPPRLASVMPAAVALDSRVEWATIFANATFARSGSIAAWTRCVSVRISVIVIVSSVLFATNRSTTSRSMFKLILKIMVTIIFHLKKETTFLKISNFSFWVV